MTLHTDKLMNHMSHCENFIFNPSGLSITSPIVFESESKQYGACNFKLNNQLIRFRISKITPKKIGQFVTLWHRQKNGTTTPFNKNDMAILFIICAFDENHFGQFIFPKDILVQKGILSHNGALGKRAMRIYPPWTHPNNKQAINTQKWQMNYFLEVSYSKKIDIERSKTLFSSLNSPQLIDGFETTSVL